LNTRRPDGPGRSFKQTFDNRPGITYRSVSFMAKAVNSPKADSAARRQILRAALKHFANAGYAATSVQAIVDDAKVSKPALYYHFRDKAALFQTLVSEAHDERFEVVQQAAARGKDCRNQLIEILTSLFDYFHKNRDLTRIAFATAFAAPGEVPPDLRYLDRCQRNLEFMRSLIRRDIPLERRQIGCGHIPRHPSLWQSLFRLWRALDWMRPAGGPAWTSWSAVTRAAWPSACT